MAEDDAALRELVTRALTDEGFAVTCAADGAQAFALLQRAVRRGGPPFDLVLLDWHMPVPGEVFVERCRQLPGPRPPIVVLTGGEGVVDAALRADAHGFLRKPFDLDELCEVVSRLVPSEPSAGPRGPCGVRASRPPAPRARRRAGAAPEDDVERAEERREALARLADRVARVQASIVRNREALQALLTLEQARRLAPAEAARVRALRWQSEELLHELRLLRQRFEEIRDSRRSN